jgi:hypothetical protein
VKDGCVSPTRKLDDHAIVSAFVLVVFCELCAQPAGFDANYWIDAWIERHILSEDLDSEQILFDLAALA